MKRVLVREACEWLPNVKREKVVAPQRHEASVFFLFVIRRTLFDACPRTASIETITSP